MKDLIDKKEREILTWFFGYIGTSLGLVQKGKLIDGAELHDIYKSAKEVLHKRLSIGWDEQSIREALLAAYHLKIKTVSLSEVLPSSPPGEEDKNLIKSGQSHCHSELLKLTPPTLYRDTKGNLILANPGSLEEVKKYTLKNLVDYYIRELSPPKVIRKDIINSIKYFLDSYTLDEILFAIDIWKHEDNSLDRGINSWDLSRWFNEARIEINNRKDL